MKTKGQYAALSYIVFQDHIEGLLITRRRSRRWIIPKGWPERQLAKLIRNFDPVKKNSRTQLKSTLSTSF